MNEPNAKDVIDALCALQEVDQKRIEAEKEKQEIIERVEQLSVMLSQLESGLADKREKLKEAERWYRDREKELKEDNDKIRRAQTRLAGLSKPKEYAAVQREIEALRRSNAQKEEEIQKLRKVMSEFQDAVLEEDEQLEVMRQELANEKASTGARVQKLDEKLKSLSANHQGLESSIPAQILRRYRRIQSAWQGVAIVEVSSKGSCGGCHRQIPPQLYNTLLKNDSLESCPFCNRFLYVVPNGDEQDEE